MQRWIRFFFGTPQRALVTIGVIVVLKVTGLLNQILLEGYKLGVTVLILAVAAMFVLGPLLRRR
jgi:hypothetical protein